ncbi:YbgA family protein [Oceanotoga teriensis]|jgi:uncharacterized protein YbgA (DUF1722 family)/uncharacterized protein YbbK (DUF523 family)|uniref:Uncharacterized protein YbgA (DUF1722 family) n=1 Tax=Oceanotoga teriensis TaxID=515440 RepID=A0AA45HIX0_9BACT|nr:DUF523 and DUF1722 domain-containing protein [Oceanotoga teriensis]MDO7975941.1 DUF523 and DUF1722 domain-containing protein [Oceanotoga teriensis]PWJ95077.1 uncharacterized protein YbgA (DUF1722 family) [Oceanotoga teriensis]
MNFVKPKVVLSKCIEFAECRYNGQSISSEVVKMLKDYVEFIPVCPEVEIGLSIPRDAVRVVSDDGLSTFKLKQIKTDKDFTFEMNEFSEDFINNLEEVDGFILKSRSPSCGLNQVKVYRNTEKGAPISSKGKGFFGKKIYDFFCPKPIEDEGRLNNFRIRNHFFTAIFSIASFREVKKNMNMKNLVEFHSKNKFLILSYNEKELRILGKIVANKDKKSIEDVFFDYEKHFLNVFENIPNPNTALNVLMHVMGYFKDKISSDEKQFFLDTLKSYKDKRVPLSVPNHILKSWIIKYNEEYLSNQTFFEPYPKELYIISDSGKGRNL